LGQLPSLIVSLCRVWATGVHGDGESGNSMESAGMGMNVAVYRRDGSDNCRIPTRMDSMDAYLTSRNADASDSD